jgi:hypothetical protein
VNNSPLLSIEIKHYIFDVNSTVRGVRGSVVG